MKVLIADRLSDKAVSALRQLGVDVSINPDLTADDLPNAIDDFDILVVRSTKVTARTIQSAKNLSLIIRAGAGVNTIDVSEANLHGVYVANCPGKNTEAVAELTIGLMIAADRQIVNAAISMRDGKWKKKEYGKANGLKGRTLGIVGLGQIGRAVAQRAQAFEMKVIAWSRSLTLEKAESLNIGYASTLQEIAERSDAVSVHVAYKKETHHLINSSFFSAMKQGAIFINTSRGEVVDTAALKSAIREKKLRVGLDVFEDEPATGDAPFNDLELASLISATPHIGASTEQAAEAIADEVVTIVRAFKETGMPINVVNVRTKSSATASLVIRHYNKVGVLAAILTKLKENGINVEEMTNTIFEDSKAACCTMLIDGMPSPESIAEMQKNENVIEVLVKPLSQ